MIDFFKKILRKFGFQLKLFPDMDFRRRMKIVRHYKINKLIDIGANTGQFALFMREIGYNHHIISFEPLSEAYQILQSKAKKDALWEALHMGIGDVNKSLQINVSENSQSSSFLAMDKKHLNSTPDSKYIAQEKIEVKRLDSVMSQFFNKSEDRLMIKVDTQGFEKKVIDGAAEVLKHALILQLEMSIVPLYEGEMLFKDMIDYLDERNYTLYSLEPGISDSITGQLLQVDGVFVNRTMIKA